MKKFIFMFIVLLILGCSNDVVGPVENSAEIIEPFENFYYPMFSVVNVEVIGDNIESVTMWTSSDPTTTKDFSDPFILPVELGSDRSLAIYLIVVFHDQSTVELDRTIQIRG
jgi:hypothetical protein